MKSIYQNQLEQLVSKFKLNELDKDEYNKPYTMFTVGTAFGDVVLKIERSNRKQISFRFIDISEYNKRALIKFGKDIKILSNKIAWDINTDSEIMALETLFNQLSMIVPQTKKQGLKKPVYKTVAKNPFL